MLNSLYATYILWPLAAILDFRQKIMFRSWETLGLLIDH